MTKIVFFGTGPVAAKSVAFLTTQFEIEAIITKPRPSHHRGEMPVEDFALQHNIPLHFAATKAELDSIFDNNKFSSPCGIVVDFGIIISRNVIDSFPKGIVNSHYSLLPQWRGADPISYTILSGQPKTGVSLMVIDEGLDTGKLITYKTIPVDPKDTTLTLTDKLIELSNSLFAQYLQLYIDGEITPKNQPHPDRATYSHKIHKSDGIIDWNEPAEVIERKIRAYAGWPQSRTTIGTIDVIVTSADVVSMGPSEPGKVMAEKSRLFIGTGSEWLEIHTLKPAGKKEMPVQAFLAGYRSELAA